MSFPGSSRIARDEPTRIHLAVRAQNACSAPARRLHMSTKLFALEIEREDGMVM